MQHYALFRLHEGTAFGVLSSDPTRCCNDLFLYVVAK